MTDESDDVVAVTDGKSLEELFPGFYPPTKSERSNVYLHGLVSLDANALLDLYRFTEQSRNEFFAILEKMQNRLFVTHQAALEFHRDRVGVVEARLRAPEEKCDEINKPLQSVIEKISEFTNRHQISGLAKQELVDMVEHLSNNLCAAIMQIGAYDLSRQEVIDGADPVLRRLSELLHQRVGIEPGEGDRVEMFKEAERRAGLRIPPGYADRDKPPERRGGDYFVWRQLMGEARIHGKPVLLSAYP